jgi:hypothetical protein
MFLIKPQKKKRSKAKLLGAVQINNTSYFVCKNNEGDICLKTGNEEKIQKAILQRMIELNPSIKRILGEYNIKPIINTKTLKGRVSSPSNKQCWFVGDCDIKVSISEQ